MKTPFCLSITLGVALALLSGCATQKPVGPVNGNLSTTDPANKVYDRSDLDRSGRSETGSALRHIDPDVGGRGGGY